MTEPKPLLKQNEARRKELERFQQALDVESLNNSVDDGRMGRRIAHINAEAEMEKEFQEEEDERVTKVVHDKQEQAEKEEREGVEHKEQLDKELQKQLVLDKNWREYREHQDETDKFNRENQDALVIQIEDKRQGVLNQREDDVNYRKQTDARYKMDSDEERHKGDMLKEQNVQYGQDLMRQIEGNAARKKEAVDLENSNSKNVWDFDKFWDMKYRKTAEEQKK